MASQSFDYEGLDECYFKNALCALNNIWTFISNIVLYIDLSWDHEDILYSDALVVNDDIESHILVSCFEAQRESKVLIKFTEAKENS